MDSFDELVRSIRPGLMAVAVAVTLDREVAADVVQDTLLVAYRSWDDVCGMERPDLWVRHVLINKAIDARRRWRRRIVLLDRLTRDRALFAQLGDTVAFWEAVRVLPQRQQEVVTLRTAGELSIEEIASMLGLAPGTVKATLHAARRTMRAALFDTTTDADQTTEVE